MSTNAKFIIDDDLLPDKQKLIELLEKVPTTLEGFTSLTKFNAIDSCLFMANGSREISDSILTGIIIGLLIAKENIEKKGETN